MSETTTKFVPRVKDTDHLKQLLGIPYSEEQLKAITAPLGQAQAIIAGAGSGKTAVMAARVVWLVGHVGVAPEEILGLTFTTKAAAELARRVRYSLQAAGIATDEGEPEVSTYHSFASSLIREHGIRMGLEPDLAILGEAKRFGLGAAVARSHTRPLQKVSDKLTSTVPEVLKLDGQLSEHLVTPSQLRDFDRRFIEQFTTLPKPSSFQKRVSEVAAKRLELSYLVDEYRAAKREANVMDYSDQMAWGAELAALPEVAASVGERFSVVLLDEYQDTSIAQRDLLRSLFLGHSISAVGDPTQGIYGWRGAASGNLTGFLNDFTPEGETPSEAFSLSVTRRCAPEIIELAGIIAQPFYSQPEVAAVVTPLKAAPENAAGTISLALYDTVAEEIEALANLVEKAREREGAWSKIAILVRNGRENGELVRTLRSRGIPVELLGLKGLLSQPEVLDVLSVLGVLEDVTNNPALLRLLAGPRWRIGDRDLVLLGRRARALAKEDEDQAEKVSESEIQRLLEEAVSETEPTTLHSLFEAVESPGTAAYDPDALVRFADLANMITRVRKHAHEPLNDLVRIVIRELDLDVELDVARIGTDNLNLLLDAVADYAADDPYASLTGLIAYLKDEDTHNDGMDVAAPSASDSVKVMTIHKAKGLEFASVFIPFMSKKVFPSDRARDSWLTIAKALPHPLRGDVGQLPEWDIEDKDGKDYGAEMKADALMEELRLAYVGFTRAETYLHLSGHHWGRTQVKPRGPSQFLMTAKDWLEAKGIAPLEWAEDPEDGSENPHGLGNVATWPAPHDPMVERREFAAMVAAAMSGEAGSSNTNSVGDVVESLSADVVALLAEASEADSDVIDVERPGTLSVTAMMSLAKDESKFAAHLARPMPREPISAARFGTRFHAWVENRYDQQSLFAPDELPGFEEEEIESSEELTKLQEIFEKSEYANREPVATEVSFTLQLGAETVIGTIDAVFATEYGFEIIDWKTNRQQNADELQLALYRLAWAESQGIDPDNVTAGFYYVRDNATVHVNDLPGRRELEALFGLA